MKRYLGGTKVEGGYYWHVGTWEIAAVKEETGTLQGSAADKYLHAPLPVLFVAAPVMGAVFAMFLPLIGFAMPIYALGRGIFGKGRKQEQVDTGAARA